MKTLSAVLVAGVVSLIGIIESDAQQLITFDDLSPQEVYAGPIPNGYAGLEWDEFGVFDPRSFREITGFVPVGQLNGLISPRHVAFPAYIGSFDGPMTGGFHSRGHVFDLNSAYQTSAWNDGLQVEVRGFVGGVLTYSSSFTLDTTGPTLVNFNYLGIDTVKFSSHGGIPHGDPGTGSPGLVIDNLVVTIPEPSAISLLLFSAGVMGYGIAKRGLGHRKLS